MMRYLIHLRNPPAVLQYLLLISLQLPVWCGFSQQLTGSVESLKIELKNTDSDTSRIKIYFLLSNAIEPENRGMALAYGNEALRLSQKINNPRFIAGSFTHIGSIYRRESKFSTAITYFKKALENVKNNSYDAYLADTYLELAIAYLRLDRLDSARSSVEKGLKTGKNIDDQRIESELYNVLGNILKEENNFKDALEHYLKALHLSEKLQYREGLAQSLSNVGNIQYFLGNLDKAIEYAQQSLVIAQELNKPSSIAYSSRLLGRIFRKQKKYDEALKSYHEAVSIYRTSGEKREIGETYTNIGNVHYEQGNFKKALELYFAALKIKNTIRDSSGIAYDYSAIAITYYRILQKNKAIKYFDSTMIVASKVKIMPLLMDAYQGKSEIYSELKNFRLAHENYLRYSAIKDSLATLRNKEATDELEAKYQNEKKGNEILALNAENEIKTLQLEKRSGQRNYLLGLVALSLILIAVGYSRYKIKLLAAKKLQELDTLKSRFFANISHEFRTPLSLILGPLQKALSQTDKPIGKTEIGLMHRNARRLHELINQLLDISKIESGKMTLHIEEVNVGHVLRIVFSSFDSLAEQKNIEYKIDMNEDPINGFVDRDKLEKIVYNLLSNAFKFTPAGGKIVLEVKHENHMGRICVKDSGIGISSKNLPFIFDRFYQIDDSATRSGEGTGIGLALAKELAEVHHGTITATSEEGKGSTFLLALPIYREAYTETSLRTAGKENETPEDSADIDYEYNIPLTSFLENSQELPLILIAEDNTDMRTFIAENIGENYSIIEASNGVEAWEKAQMMVPDLVITDVMMPGMDGKTFTAKLKTTLATSHIPVVMLTARADLDSKIDGLNLGADDYLTKPFEIRELQVRIHNLIDQRKKLRTLFHQEITLQPKDIVVTSADAEFINKVISILEKHFSDAEFGVEEFNRAIGFSRMQLHRKLKALTDQSTGEFIKRFRMEKAKQFLAAKGAKVSQVAYDSGFNNVSHFSKTFKEYTGITPSEFIEHPIKNMEMLPSAK